LSFRPLKRLGAVTVLVGTLALAAGATPAQAITCDHVASPDGSDTAAGTYSSPFKTVARLIDSLSAGQTGCLRGGTYTQSEVRFRRAGASGAPITLTSYPGERATLKGGYVYVMNGADYVTISNLNIDATASTTQNAVQILARDTILEDSDITNGNVRVCIILGSNSGYGQSVRTVIRRNRIHHCGDPAAGNQHHAIYFENTIDAYVADNIFWATSAFAIHLYPNAQHSLIEHNVIVDNGRGVTFSGDSTRASNNNEVRYNIIASETLDYAVTSWWGGPVGTGNTAHDNCLYSNPMGDFNGGTGYTRYANAHADPMFVNASAHDYRLSTSSTCLAVVGYDTAAKLAGASSSPSSPPPPADVEPPVVGFKTLASGQTVKGALSEVAGNCEVTATDASGVAKVAFYLDGAPLNTELYAPYACSWDTTTAVDGRHVLKAVAVDQAGNAASASVDVVVANGVVNAAPTVKVTSPASGSTFAKGVTVAATASDDKGVAWVEFSIDGVVKAKDTTAPYSYAWSPSRKVRIGTHTFKATAYDAEGLSASSTVTATGQ
jgi:hypothetical protein